MQPLPSPPAPRFLPFLAALLLLSACSNDPGNPTVGSGIAPPDINALNAEAEELSRRFVESLQPALQTALQSGGPAAAIQVCAAVAPGIARELSVTSGWKIRRVSLRPRNTASAQPDSWEVVALAHFAERQQAGEAGPEIRTAALVGSTFRYMQAQPTGPLCLTCHGKELTADVRGALLQLYPDDAATGYALGEIRGAISLSKDL